MQSTYSLNTITKIGSFFAGASQTVSITQWDRSLLYESVTRGIELLEISIPYYIHQTSESADLTDLLLSEVAEHGTDGNSSSGITLDAIIVEYVRRLEAGDFTNNISLADRWAKPGLNLSDEDLAATLSEINSEWEQDLDDLFPEN